MRIAPSSALKSPPTSQATGRTTPGARSFGTVLDGRVGFAPETPPAAAGTAAAIPAPARVSRGPASPLRAMLERAVGNEKQIDALLDAAARGKTFKPGELLAMQATVARYSQTVEVVSRVADRLVGAIKQTMGTQV